ncbi:MAG: hypothetical protein ACOYXB_12700 [Bacteroidota bacterium]
MIILLSIVVLQRRYLVRVSFKNGEEIISNEDHPFYVFNKGWCSFNPQATYDNYGLQVKLLQPSDMCLSIFGDKIKKQKIFRIAPLDMTIKTYNLSKISNSTNFFANGILVSNESNSMK